MEKQYLVEVYSAGCAVCEEAVALVKRIAGSYEVRVQHMTDIETVKKAKALGIRTVPAVVIDGELAACCKGNGIDEAVLRVAGLGKS